MHVKKGLSIKLNRSCQVYPIYMALTLHSPAKLGLHWQKEPVEFWENSLRRENATFSYLTRQLSW